MRRHLVLAALLAAAITAPAAAQTSSPMHAAAMPAKPKPPLYLIFFQPWSAEITPHSMKIIEHAVAKAKATPLSHVNVLGYADMEGSAKANLDLTKNRVEAVRAKLVQAGYPKDSITVRPFGSVQPIGDPQESRRVEITITAPGQ